MRLGFIPSPIGKVRTRFGAVLAVPILTALQPAPPVSDVRPEPVINTGSGLLENCSFEAEASNQADLEFHLGLCIGFIKGATNVWTELNPGKLCPPEELDNEKLRDVVVAWLRSHPASMGAPAVGSVLSATTEAFPCKTDVQPE